MLASQRVNGWGRAAVLAVCMQAVGATGDEGGPPRLARWLEARKAERELERERRMCKYKAQLAEKKRRQQVIEQRREQNSQQFEEQRLR